MRGFEVRAEAKKWPRSRLFAGTRGGYHGRNVAEREIRMSEKTFQQKFGAFALVAAVVLLIVNLTVVGLTVLGISTPLLLSITGIIMMRGERSSGGAKDD